ncbi:MAG: hypothetical protein H6Q66_2424 [Firmicutes bacterium]|nr:hypothetical protein [Bacillota bacterium]
MCLIVLAYRKHPRFPLIIAANRDEYYKRPTASAAFWTEYPYILAGRDLDQMGTWLGITKSGRFAAITNYRDPNTTRQDAKSRGQIVRDFLCGNDAPANFLQKIDPIREDFNGFNLLVGDNHGLMYYSSRTGKGQELKPGIHGLSNHLLDTPWPKVTAAKERMGEALADVETMCGENLFSLLSDVSAPPDDELPLTGISLEWERALAPIFIVSPDYGTRSSTVLLQDCAGHVIFMERTFPGTIDVKYEFDIQY